MLRSLDDLRGYGIEARDGRIGSISDFYFDDWSWKIRYFVVDTGSWFSGREVLLSPACAGAPGEHSGTVPVDLTLEQVRNSPDSDTDRPVSRQREIDLAGYYGWPVYWGSAAMPLATYTPPPSPPVERELRARTPAESENEPNLRSAKEVTGYRITATDGEIGSISDLIADEAGWEITYLTVDTGKWLPGRKVILPRTLIEQIRWTDRDAVVNIPRELIQKAPAFELLPLSPEFEQGIRSYYGSPKTRTAR